MRPNPARTRALLAALTGLTALTALAACGGGPAAPAGSAGPHQAATATASGQPRPTAPSPSAPSPSAPSPSAPSPAGTPPRPVTLPPPNAPADYQIGGAYRPPRGVRVLSRDRSARPLPGLYNICYVNAFQAQPAELPWWRANHPDLLLKDGAGRYVIDTDWQETLLDTSTAAKRAALAAIVGGWIDGCAAAGFQAVEPDNLDSYERGKGLLTRTDALAYVTELAARAHRDGLAIAQKNALDLATAAHTRAGLDFAITEQCAQYEECADYTAVYGAHVLDIEYERPAYTKACAGVGRTVSVVFRDVDVSAPDSETYEYGSC